MTALAELKAELATLRALFARAVRVNFAYTSALPMTLIGVGFSTVIPMLIWRHVYQVNPRALPLPPDELFSYLLVAGCLNYVSMMNVEGRIGQRIRLGLIAIDLLRPVDFQLGQVTQALADALFNVLVMLPLFALAVLLWGEAALPESLPALAAAAVSALLGMTILFAISYIIVQAAFVTYSGYGVFVARNALQLTFSGLSAPLVLFPDRLRTIAEWLPFRHTIHTPVSIFVGWIDGAAIARALLAQLVWAAALLLFGRWLLGVSLRRFEVQGG
ncbi:MAG TPA: ABC-2 family transporter protein [Polyangiaceae bacterium]|jgi:ABC-2 type transport system permease protein|nr:ABC-2 family transporter protein [Polyangiaceae bacterium]